jgi:hypothetical protein
MQAFSEGDLILTTCIQCGINYSKNGANQHSELHRLADNGVIPMVDKGNDSQTGKRMILPLGNWPFLMRHWWFETRWGNDLCVDRKGWVQLKDFPGNIFGKVVDEPIST